MNETLGSAQKLRREFLEKAGEFAAYTPPAIAMLMYPGTEAIASNVGRGGGRGGGGGGGRGGGGRGRGRGR